jgi:hypothetical protein
VGKNGAVLAEIIDQMGQHTDRRVDPNAHIEDRVAITSTRRDSDQARVYETAK